MEDRECACRAGSVRGTISWRQFPAWIIVCLAILAVPALTWGQADQKAAGNAAGDPSTDLPPGYEPPRDPPPEMLFEKRLMTPEDSKRISKELNRKYLKRLRAGDLRSDEAKTEVLDGIRYRLNELTIRDNLKNLTDLRTRITGAGGDLYQAGRLVDKPDKVREFRRELLQMIIKEIEPLFENNYFVRIQAALILGELNLMEEDAQANISREAFPPAAEPLIQALRDPEQFEAVKIVSVLSLMRILSIGNPNVQQKRDVALALVSELKRPLGETSDWYQRRLAEALGHIDVSLDLNRAPFVYDVLNSVMNDPKRDLRTRIQAAWSLARHPLEPGVDIPKLVVDAASLGKDLAQAQAANPKNPELRWCAYVLYLAFQAKDETDKDAKGERPGGLLNTPAAAGIAKDAYAQVLPIVREIIAGKTIPPERVQDLGKWLQAHGHVAKPQPEPVAEEPKPAATQPSGNKTAPAPAAISE